MSIGIWTTVANLVAPGTAIASSSARTSLTVGSTQARWTMPGNFLKVPGDQLLLEASGIITTVVTTPGTLTLDMALGTVANCSTGAMTLNTVAQTNMPWSLKILMSAFTVGAATAAQLRFTGYWLSEASVGAALGATGPGPGGQMIPYSGTATGASTLGTTFDSTVSNQVDLYSTFSVSTANSIQLLQYSLSMLTNTGL